VAANCWVIPAITVGLAGVTAIDFSVAAVTVRLAEPSTPLAVCVARMVVEPTATAVARPEGLTVAMDVEPELHVTTAGVSVCVEPSLNVAVAVNCCVVPLASFFVAGVTVTNVTVAALTLMVAVAVTAAGADAVVVAMMVVLPGPTAVTTPAEDTVATDVLAEDQVTVVVRFFVVLLLYVPVATSVCVVFAASVVVPGVTATDISVTETLTVALPLIVPLCAVMVADPLEMAVTTPDAPTVATLVSLEVHVAELVRFCWVPLL
jgi:hypothetical protein